MSEGSIIYLFINRIYFVMLYWPYHVIMQKCCINIIMSYSMNHSLSFPKHWSPLGLECDQNNSFWPNGKVIIDCSLISWIIIMREFIQKNYFIKHIVQAFAIIKLIESEKVKKIKRSYLIHSLLQKIWSKLRHTDVHRNNLLLMIKLS